MEFLKQPRALFDTIVEFKQAGLAEIEEHHKQKDIPEENRIIKHPSGLWKP